MIVGGSNPTRFAVDYANLFSEFDFVTPGEGETALASAIEVLRSGSVPTSKIVHSRARDSRGWIGPLQASTISP